MPSSPGPSPAPTAPTASDVARTLDRARPPLRLAYLGIVLLATLTGLRWDPDPARVADRLGDMLRPDVGLSGVVDGARNVVLFAGWGLVWMVTSAPGRSWAALRNAILTGAALSLTVETAQLLSRTRVASILDLLTNTAGAAAGAAVTVGLVIATARSVRARSYVGMPAALFALPYLGAVCAEAAIPLFRQEDAVPVSGSILQRMAQGLERFDAASILDLPLTDIALFLPAGALAVAALYESGRPYRASAALVTAGAAVVFPALEVLHGGLGIPIGLGAVVTHVGAVATGAWAAAAGLPRLTRSLRGATRPRLLAAAYMVVLATWSLRPFLPNTDPGAIVDAFTAPWWIPLRGLGFQMDFFSVSDVFVGFLLYLPVGALLAVWPLALRGWLAGPWPAVLFAVAIELAQPIVAARTLDVTDILLQAAGVGVGWLVARRAGFAPHGAMLAGSRRRGAA